MSFEKSFCPSPWFHMRITNSGTYEYCRWMVKNRQVDVDLPVNIANYSPSKYFKEIMAPIRQQLLDGESPPDCRDCNTMEQHGKVSGRLRQLLKVGITTEHFESTLASSTFKPAFDYSVENSGAINLMPQDWQIDLGNYCNSQCIMCNPRFSSRLATEFKLLGLINSVPPRSWCDDPKLLDKFCQDLIASPQIRYLHFIGGETLITPGFQKILSVLIDYNMAQSITVGFTTNLTIWDQSIVDLLSKFKTVNLGLSIETLSPINDYIRYPSQLDTTRQILNQWVNLAKELGWSTQLRITPTCLSIDQITTLYDYAWQHGLAVESCNFLDNPEFLRISVLPMDIRQKIASKISQWIDQHPADDAVVINTRNPNLHQGQVAQDAQSYVNYLLNAKDESYLLPELVKYLKLLESSRGNSVLTYLPEYEELFRRQGY